MAGNKYDTGFAPIIVEKFKLEYTTEYGHTIFEGTANQIIAHVGLVNSSAVAAILNKK